ncbi:MAG TPA: hypothetical protein VK138_05695 [Acidiferrobacterales bacterium]|nr:hypothetical protein [Acidiferrobacterales bacterium]
MKAINIYLDGFHLWSFNKDGEVKPGLVEQRDKRMGDSLEKKSQRSDLTPLTQPQQRTDAVKFTSTK